MPAHQVSTLVEAAEGFLAAIKTYVTARPITPLGATEPAKYERVVVMLTPAEPPSAPSAEPQPAEPQPAEPQPAEPQPAEPQPAEPQPAEPQPAEPPAAELSADTVLAPELSDAVTSARQVSFADPDEAPAAAQPAELLAATEPL